MELRKLQKPSLSSMVYNDLREAIVHGRLEPGQVLKIGRLAKDFGISHTPVREALAMLEQEGMVNSIPYRGVFVTAPTQAEEELIVPVLECLETLAVKYAIDAIPDSEIDQVANLIKTSWPALESGDSEAHINSNRAFHSLAIDHCGNPVLAKLIRDLHDKRAGFVQVVQDIGPRVYLVSAKEHLEILEAYRGRDLERACELLIHHTRQPPKRYYKLLAEQASETPLSQEGK